ncbi:hypothetical protein B0A52_05551 [Exophiala mesophila]|uniref:Tyrosine specific protein phosphatases domain-containing protein n=1 Tax=Exophiala mesophila TaxID=212818 RepID=A0A438N3G9_EXOME|nr:hypothetical protein B0A52_05551 [Exophiala mesophila]
MAPSRDQHATKNLEAFRPLLETPIEQDIDPVALQIATNTLPFISIPGVFNFRDLGHHPRLKQGLLYRSGTLFTVEPAGVNMLINDLNVRTVFDFRSSGERKAFAFPELENDKGSITVHWEPSDTPAETNISDFVDLETESHLWHGGARGFSKMYLDTLEVHKASFRAVLQHVLLRPHEPIVFNCTAGKDRTGVMAALVLTLADVPDHEIAADYALSRIGIESRKEFLTGIIRMWKPEWTSETAGMRGFSNVRPEYMAQFLHDARIKYADKRGEGNWAAQYAHHDLGFELHDVDTIRANMQPSQVE